ncbi:hypothetical protein GGI15_003511 [Coemansia interrupta]|uniref:Uncharacterized protein n=1 Tax=Coemansia interrupta TaxID=1126814 RepID=A0A9W8LIG5_9FUNG|nr:hypothetical protein GGI15_003511 [Coemansia interrupta]
MTKHLTIVVFGATGQQGGSVLRTLAAHRTAYTLRAVTRSLATPKAVALASQYPWVHLFEADLSEPSTFAAALQDADIVFGVTPSTSSPACEYEQGKNLIDACVFANVRLLIFSTLPSPSKISRGQHSNVHHFESKYQIQQYLMSAMPRITVAAIQIAVYYQNTLQSARWDDSGDEVIFGFPGHPDRKLAYADVARDTGAMVKHIIDQRNELVNGQVFPVVSGYYSPNDIAQAFTRISGIQARAVEVPLSFVRGAERQAMYEFYADYDIFAESPLDTDQALTTPERFWRSSGFNDAPVDNDGLPLVIVICHGLLDTKSSPLFTHLQTSLPYTTLAFDFPGNGLSTGQTRYGDYYQEATHIHDVLSHLRATNHTIMGIIGHSKGASSMLLFAYKYPALCPALLVSISARFFLARETPKRWKPEQLEKLRTEGKFLWRTYGEREYWITWEDLEMRRATDMRVVQALPLDRVRVLNIMGGSDRVVPEEDVWEYDRLMRLGAPRASQVATRVVPDATHFWTTQAELESIEHVIKQWLIGT